MPEMTFHRQLLAGFLAAAVVTFPILFFVAAPYGRFIGKPWQGPTMDNRLAWMLMELPAAVVFALTFFFGQYHSSLTSLLFLSLWQLHYIHRAFIYPLRLSGRNKRMPILIAAFSFCFNVINAYLNGQYLFTLSGGYPDSWLGDPRLLIGTGVFAAGYIINRQADQVLHKLRAPGESIYRVPRGGLFKWISSPNYLGEIVEWIGWAIATWSMPGLVFALWTMANLVPRARATHRWYKAHFPEYPPERRALLPGIW
jgi:steroid 5-alpha-reductase/3-oxo-5-alpha-steroid 4-dehydrogenase 1